MGIDSGYGVGSLKTGVCTSTTRPAVPFEGQTIYETDTDLTKVYNGTAFVNVGGGLVCVKAETAFSAVTSFTADSIFTSNYTNYKIIIRHTATTQGSITMQLRASAVAATSNYNYQRAAFVSTVSSPVRYSSQSSFYVGDGAGGDFMQSNWIEITGPQLTAATTYWNLQQQSDGANTSQALTMYSGINSNATAYDGMAISIATGTMTGTYTIYGYAKTV